MHVYEKLTGFVIRIQYIKKTRNEEIFLLQNMERSLKLVNCKHFRCSW